MKAFVCNSCASRHGVDIKHPADSGAESWPCSVCGHRNIGSYMECFLDKYEREVPVGSKLVPPPDPDVCVWRPTIVRDWKGQCGTRAPGRPDTPQECCCGRSVRIYGEDQ